MARPYGIISPSFLRKQEPRASAVAAVLGPRLRGDDGDAQPSPHKGRGGIPRRIETPLPPEPVEGVGEGGARCAAAGGRGASHSFLKVGTRRILPAKGVRHCEE